MREVNFLQSLHTSTKRNYLERMTAEKPECMRIAKAFGAEYWDGDRKYGYGGYHYDGRWKSVAEEIVKHYGLTNDGAILDIGAGKGYLIYEIANAIKYIHRGILPSDDIVACDISSYALNNFCDGVPDADLASWITLRNKFHFYGNSIFDFVYSINVFHNLGYRDLKSAIKEMVRVGKEKMYICVESYRTEEELTSLQAWQLTCLSYYSPDDWLQIYEDCGYKGDCEFIFFS